MIKEKSKKIKLAKRVRQVKKLKLKIRRNN